MVDIQFNLDKYTPSQIKELLPIIVQQSGVNSFAQLKNIYSVKEMQKMKTPVFQFLFKYYDLFGMEEYLRSIDEIEHTILSFKKTSFTNLVLEPKHLSEQTVQVVENRHKALKMYKEEGKSFEVLLEFEPDNYFDHNAIAVYAAGKKNKYHIGYISRSFNIRIGELLKENEFPLIQANYEDIIKGKYSEDNLVIDVFF